MSTKKGTGGSFITPEHIGGKRKNGEGQSPDDKEVKCSKCDDLTKSEAIDKRFSDPTCRSCARKNRGGAASSKRKHSSISKGGGGGGGAAASSGSSSGSPPRESPTKTLDLDTAPEAQNFVFSVVGSTRDGAWNLIQQILRFHHLQDNMSALEAERQPSKKDSMTCSALAAVADLWGYSPREQPKGQTESKLETEGVDEAVERVRTTTGMFNLTSSDSTEGDVCMALTTYFVELVRLANCGIIIRHEQPLRSARDASSTKHLSGRMDFALRRKDVDCDGDERICLILEAKQPLADSMDAAFKQAWLYALILFSATAKNKMVVLVGSSWHRWRVGVVHPKFPNHPLIILDTNDKDKRNVLCRIAVTILDLLKTEDSAIQEEIEAAAANPTAARGIMDGAAAPTAELSEQSSPPPVIEATVRSDETTGEAAAAAYPTAAGGTTDGAAAPTAELLEQSSLPPVISDNESDDMLHKQDPAPELVLETGGDSKNKMTSETES